MGYTQQRNSGRKNIMPIVFTNTCETCKEEEAVVVNDGVWRCAGCAEVLIDVLQAKHKDACELIDTLTTPAL